MIEDPFQQVAAPESGESQYSLKVEDMKASRPEDVEEILNRIPDKQAFNEHVQRLLFQELFPAWHHADDMAQMERIGRNARWLKLHA